MVVKGEKVIDIAQSSVLDKQDLTGDKETCSVVEKNITNSTKTKQYFSSFINILKACIGAGILAYPSLFQTYGYINAILYTCLFGFVSYCGCVLYMLINAQILEKNKGEKKVSLSGMSEYVLPVLKIFVDFIVIVKCLFVSMSYFALIHETLTNIITDTGIYKEDSTAGGLKAVTNYIFCGVCALTVPFICATKIDMLKKASFLGFVGVILLLIISFYYVHVIPKEAIEKSMEMFVGANVLKSLGAFVFSYTCHQNIVDVQNEADLLSVKNLCVNIGCVYIATTVIYVMFGFLNYKAFNNVTISGKIFDTWSAGKVKTFGLITYVIFLCVTIPLHVHPIKAQVSVLLGIVNLWIVRGIGISVVVAMCVLSITKVWNFQGISRFVSQTFSAFLVFLLPTIYYVLYKGKKMAFGYVMCALCTANGLLCLVNVILDLTIWKQK